MKDGLHPSPFVCALSPSQNQLLNPKVCLTCTPCYAGEKKVCVWEGVFGPDRGESEAGKRKRSMLSRSRGVDERDFQCDFQGPN